MAAWSVQIDEVITRQLVDMDDKTQSQFLMAMVDIGNDPYRGHAYRPESGQYGIAVGDLGVIVYGLVEDRHHIVILDVLWVN